MSVSTVSAYIFFIKLLAVVVHNLPTAQNLFNSRCCFAEEGKEGYQEQALCTGHMVRNKFAGTQKVVGLPKQRKDGLDWKFRPSIISSV